MNLCLNQRAPVALGGQQKDRSDITMQALNNLWLQEIPLRQKSEEQPYAGRFWTETVLAFHFLLS